MSSSAPHADTALRAQNAEERPSLGSRLISQRAVGQLFRNTVASCLAFAFGILLLWLFVQEFHMNTYLAAAISFIAANSVHYALGRRWVFAGSNRGLGSSYFYFFVNAAIGLAVTMALFALFTALAGLHYLIARVVASIFAGLAMFVSNALLNFKSL